jgi:1,4-alpha-glucan branching enzyme
MPGVFAVMLHSHIPYCRKSGVWPAGEEWLFEAMNETYIPLLRAVRSLYFDGIHPRIMVGLVPILMEQLCDEYMKDRFCAYMEDKINRARNDVARFHAEPLMRQVARYWQDLFEENYKAYTADFYRDILGTLKWLQDEGVIEVLTSAATHGFLPLMESDDMVRAQIRIGVQTYKKYFGRSPRGFWLPECAYRPQEWSKKDQRMRKAIDEWLADEGIEYFFVENVGITHASFMGNRHQEDSPSTYRGYRLSSGVCVFGRNEETGKQVWSPEIGYPGDPYYLEFHRKDSESGLHYWRVTGGSDKQVYDPDLALERIESHAQHFTGLIGRLLNQKGFSDAEPIIVSPYDCELFGHWWHEGVNWLEKVYRLLAKDGTVSCRSLGEYLDTYREGFSIISMQPSTWGLNSDFTVWQNPDHGWIWPYINSSAREAEEIIDRVHPQDERARRILRQMARELLLMQGSDWPFLLFTAQAKEYANQRFHHHHQRFLKLIWAAKDLSDHSRLSEEQLHQIEDIDCPWPDLDWTIFSRSGENAWDQPNNPGKRHRARE